VGEEKGGPTSMQSRARQRAAVSTSRATQRCGTAAERWSSELPSPQAARTEAGY
jgi:hypothetical protein